MIGTKPPSTHPSACLYSAVTFRIPRVTLEKHSIFKPVSKAAEVRKTVPEAAEKTLKSTLDSFKHDFCENMVSAIPSIRKPCFESSDGQEVHAKISAKSLMETSLNKK